MLSNWDFDERVFFQTINTTQDAEYENIPEHTIKPNEAEEFFKEDNYDESSVLKEVCTMSNLCESDLFVL